MMNSVLLFMLLVVAVGAANADKAQSVLREVVKGQLDVIKHCVGLRGYPYSGIPPHPIYPRKRYIVAFHVRSSKALQNISDKEKVVFDTVDVNEGSGYNAKDGTFAAPINGFYVFQWTILARLRTSFITELIVNDSIKGMNHAYAHPISWNLSASQTVIVHMNKGVKAWIKVSSRTGKYMYGGYWSTFSGYQL